MITVYVSNTHRGLQTPPDAQLVYHSDRQTLAAALPLSERGDLHNTTGTWYDSDVFNTCNSTKIDAWHFIIVNSSCEKSVLSSHIICSKYFFRSLFHCQTTSTKKNACLDPCVYGDDARPASTGRHRQVVHVQEAMARSPPRSQMPRQSWLRDTKRNRMQTSIIQNI